LLRRLWTVGLGCLVAVALAGCPSSNQQPAGGTGGEPEAVSSQAGEQVEGEEEAEEEAGEQHEEAAEEEGHEHGEQAKSDDAVAANLAKLPEQDRAAAEKQKVCPVSGEPLGKMGVPVKVTVKDSKGAEHTVFLCCPHCKEAIEKDPDKYLAKLNQ